LPVLLSVVVCTRNRPDDLRECVATILAAESAPAFELLVVDQSDGEESARALEGALSDPRVRLVRTPTRGLSQARNIAIASARSEAILFTDDDCRVRADWVAKAWALLEDDPKTAVAFGAVRPPAGTPDGVVMSAFEPTRDEVFEGTYPHPMQPWGVGANMLIRRRVFETVGGFDPVLGAGGRIGAGEDTDFLLRALGAGYRVRKTPAFEVLHLGVRTGKAAAKLFVVYAVGAGAAYAKNLRLRTPGVPLLVVRFVLANLAAAVKNVFVMGRPRGASFVWHLSRGAVLSLRYRLDSKSQCLVSTPP
jgi:GT2 family glycosyltransferase